MVEIAQMNIIYNGDKHRSFWRVAYRLAFGVTLGAIVLMLVFGDKEIGPGWTAITVMFAGYGLWTALSTLHEYLTLPIDVTILESGAIQVRPRSGDPISLAATQFTRIAYVYEGRNGTLTMEADVRTWSLPVSEHEADEIMGALLALNPLIEIDWKEKTYASA